MPSSTLNWQMSIAEIDRAVDELSRSNSEGLMRHYGGETPYLRPKQDLTLLAHYREVEFQMARLVIGWLPTTPSFDLKGALAYWAHRIIQVARQFDQRMKELPGRCPEVGQSAPIRELRDVIARAPTSAQFVAGIFKIVQARLLEALAGHQAACDPIADLPTIDTLRHARDELRNQIAWADEILAQEAAIEERLELDKWCNYVAAAFEALGGANGQEPRRPPKSPLGRAAPVNACAEPAQLESGFFVTDDFMYLVERPTEGTLSDILFHNLTEIFVPDGLAYMIYDVDGMPFDFYVDFIRQIWDESRHAQMGRRELLRLGIDVSRLPLNTVRRPVSYTHTLATIGYTGEGCSFPRKLASVAGFYEQRAMYAGLVTEFDIADEQQHVCQIHRWLPLLHKHEKCEQSLTEVIQQAQRDALQKWEGKERQKNGTLTRARQAVGQFGAFCREVDFEIDFGRLS